MFSVFSRVISWLDGLYKAEKFPKLQASKKSDPEAVKRRRLIYRAGEFRREVDPVLRKFNERRDYPMTQVNHQYMRQIIEAAIEEAHALSGAISREIVILQDPGSSPSNFLPQLRRELGALEALSASLEAHKRFLKRASHPS